LKGRDFVPSHEIAVSVACSPDLSAVELSREDALCYLRKEPPMLPDDVPPGWTLMTYAGHALGWAKVLTGRVNNYLPTELRLRMQPPSPDKS
jgi:NOL1/NOP2/fmu family ribosome biogenesis protein